MFSDQDYARAMTHNARMDDMRRFFEREKLIDGMYEWDRLVDADGPQQAREPFLRSALRRIGLRLTAWGEALEAKHAPEAKSRLRTGEFPAV